MRTHLKSIVALATVVILAVTGASIAAGGTTQIAVQPTATLMPGDMSPFDVAGVKAIRRGKAIPSGYRLIGRQVTITRDRASAGAALFFRCPGHKRLKSFATQGPVGFSADRRYVDHRQTWVRSGPGKRGEEVSGAIYAVCR